MIRTVLVTAFLLTTGSAFAADLPQPAPPQAPTAYVPAPLPVYDWSGIYIGVNGGYGFASGNATYTFTGNPFIGGTATGSGNLDGFLIGGTLGANFQSGQFVFGVEGDWDYSGQSKTDSVGCGIGCSVSETYKVPWLATVRGRVGYAFDRVLVYGTAGGAVLNASDSVNATAGGITASIISVSDTAFGWTAGAGVEVGITPWLTAKAEYLFVSATPSGTGAIPTALGGGTVSESVTIYDNIVRAGLNFKFNPF